MELLVLVAMLTLLVSQRMLNYIRKLVPEKSARFNCLRWAGSFYAAAMGRVLEEAGVNDDPAMLLLFFMGEGPDTNYQNKEPMG